MTGGVRKERISRAACLGALLAIAFPASAGADERTTPGPHVTWPWLATQLVPSPELSLGEAGAHFGMRWQVTPLLYSFGLYPGVNPWRFLVVEPIVRQSGSIELYVSPEYLAIAPRFRDRMMLRAGVRSYFPIVQHGDYLSVSMGSSWFRIGGQDGVAYEVGVYALFGVLGLQVDYAPGFERAAWIGTLRFRYF
jgi:hypothetical protein